jgi:hypothetical protein
MTINTNPLFAFEQNLTPEQLRMLSDYQTAHPTQTFQVGDGNDIPSAPATSWALPGEFGPSFDTRPGGLISQPRNSSTWGGSDVSGTWDDKGNWLGYQSNSTDLRDFARWAATSLGAYYTMGQMPDGGGGAVSGMDLAADNPSMWNVGNISAGTGATGAAGAATTAGGETAASSKAALYGADAYGPGMTGAQTSAFDTTLGLTGSKGLAAGAAELASGGGGWLEAAKALGGSMDLGTLGKLAMAAYGASQSKDGTSTNTRDPWAPAQPFLLNQLTAGAALQDKLQQQPFSQAQQTAYGNQGNLLDAINGQMPALLAGFGANASGANQFTRGARNQRLQPVQSFNPSAYQPAGLLGYLGSR